MTVEEYLVFVKIIFTLQAIILIPILVYIQKNKMNPELKKKLKIICKRKGIRLEKHIDTVLEQYVETYTQEHKINWDELLY